MSEIISSSVPVSVVTSIDGIVQDVPLAQAAIVATAESTPVYSTGESAQAALPAGGQHVIIRAKKNNSSKDTQDGWQCFAVIPGFGATIDALGAWSEVVNAVLMSQASESLKAWRLNNPMSSSVPLALFTPQQLREDYLAGGAGLSMDKETLEKMYCASATHQAFITSDKYKFNAQYRTLVDVFKGKIVALAGRPSRSTVTDADLLTILSKLHDDDMATQFGVYVIARITQLQKKREEEQDDADLTAL